MTTSDDRRRRVRVLQKYLLNPPVKALVHAGLVPGYALIETRGRRTGRHRRTVVGVHREGDVVWVVAEQGGQAGYVRNLRSDPDVRVRLGRRWHAATAEVLPDDDAGERLRRFGRPVHAASVRRFGTDLLTVRLTLAPGGAPPGRRGGR